VAPIAERDADFDRRGSAIELERPLVLPKPLATRLFPVAVTCHDRSAPPLKTHAA